MITTYLKIVTFDTFVFCVQILILFSLLNIHWLIISTFCINNRTSIEYSVHKLDIVKELADKLNINLIFIPSGTKSINQPLDVNFNGPVKSIGKSLANKIFLKDPFEKYTLENSIYTMTKASKKISKEVIIDSFKKGCNIY